MTKVEEKVLRTQIRKHELAQRTADDLVNLHRDTPIRARFHDYLAREGFLRIETPLPGRSYNGSTQQMLWECYLTATLEERAMASKNL